jgi:hypothetical protein
VTGLRSLAGVVEGILVGRGISGSLGPYGSWVMGSSIFCCCGTAPELVAKFVVKKVFWGVVDVVEGVVKENDVGVVVG